MFFPFHFTLHSLTHSLTNSYFCEQNTKNHLNVLSFFRSFVRPSHPDEYQSEFVVKVTKIAKTRFRFRDENYLFYKLLSLSLLYFSLFHVWNPLFPLSLSLCLAYIRSNDDSNTEINNNNEKFITSK